MGMKPRKKAEEPISGYDSVLLGTEQWTVIRKLVPGHRTKEFAMEITRGNYQLVTRGPSKGRHRMTLVVEYVDDVDRSGNK